MKSKQSLYVFFLTLAVMAMTAWAIPPANAKTAGLMNKDELKRELGSADLVVLDVRTGKDWKASEFKIKGATRANPRDFSSWKERFGKDKKIVLYCA